MREKQSFGNFLLNNAMIIFMIGAAIVVGLLRPTFFSMYNFKNLISNTAVRFIIAVGVRYWGGVNYLESPGDTVTGGAGSGITDECPPQPWSTLTTLPSAAE